MEKKILTIYIYSICDIRYSKNNILYTQVRVWIRNLRPDISAACLAGPAGRQQF